VEEIIVSTASSVVPDSHVDLLTSPGFGHLATIGPGGAPQVNPVGYFWTGERLLISVGAETQKLRNVQRDPRVAISFIDPVNPARYLEIRGTVSEIVHDVDLQMRNELMQRYLGDAVTAEPPPGERMMLSIAPARITRHG
jgi:PPOX class probable F420-dependent enzyme